MLAIGRPLELPVVKESRAHARGAAVQAQALGRRDRRKRLIFPLLLVVLLTLVQGCTSGGNDPVVTQPAATTAASEPAGQDSASAAPAQEPTPEETTAATEAPAAAKPIEYSGRGDKVLRIKKSSSGHQLISFTHSGQSKFIVHEVDAELREVENLVNSVGDYEGTTILNASGTATDRIKIQAKGEWTVRLADMATATPIGSSAEGRGDEVLHYRGKGGAIRGKHSGEGEFLVYYHNEGNALLLLAGFGQDLAESSISAGPGFLRIRAAGQWTIKIDD